MRFPSSAASAPFTGSYASMNKSNHRLARHSAWRKNQDGAALVLALILLAVLTVFAISSINISSTEEVMTRNTTSYKIALSSAEASLKDGIEAVVDSATPSIECTNLSDTSVACGASQYYKLDTGAVNIDPASESNSFWNNRASEIQSVSDAQLAAISGDSNNIPQRIVTKRRVPGSGALDTGRGGSIQQALFEVTALGRDKNGKSEIVIRKSIVRNEAK